MTAWTPNSPQRFSHPALTTSLITLRDLYDDDAPFRVDDYFLNMAVNLILDPDAHLQALATAGVLTMAAEQDDDGEDDADS